MTATYYEEVPTHAIDLKTRQAAEDMKQFCMFDLGLKSVQTRWFRKCGMYGTARQYWGEQFEWDRQILGMCKSNDDIIWINAEEPLKTTLATIAHECRHKFQQANGYASEVDAEKYEVLAMQAFRFWPGDRYRAKKITAQCDTPAGQGNRLVRQRPAASLGKPSVTARGVAAQQPRPNYSNPWRRYVMTGVLT
ncbi:MAG: hypothetical protein ACYC0Q_05955 [Eubacteriales bacterium]